MPNRKNLLPKTENIGEAGDLRKNQRAGDGRQERERVKRGSSIHDKNRGVDNQEELSRTQCDISIKSEVMPKSEAEVNCCPEGSAGNGVGISTPNGQSSAMPNCTSSRKPMTAAERQRNYRARLKQKKESEKIKNAIQREEWRKRKRQQRMRQKQTDVNNQEEVPVTQCNSIRNEDVQKQEQEFIPFSSSSNKRDVEGTMAFNGRPPLIPGGSSLRRPLTAAERQRNYRERQRKKKEKCLEEQKINKAVDVKEGFPTKLSEEYSFATAKMSSGADAMNIARDQSSTSSVSHKRPLTAAERTRNYRERQKKKKADCLQEQNIEKSILIVRDSNSEKSGEHAWNFCANKNVPNGMVTLGPALDQSSASSVSSKKPLTSAERKRNYQERQRKCLECLPEHNVDKSLIIVRDSKYTLSQELAGNSLRALEDQSSTGPWRPLTAAERMRNYRERQRRNKLEGDQKSNQREKHSKGRKRLPQVRQKQATKKEYVEKSCNENKDASNRSSSDSNEKRRALTAAERQRRYRAKLKQSPEKWADSKKRAQSSRERKKNNCLRNSAEERYNSVDPGLSYHGEGAKVDPQSTVMESILGRVSLNKSSPTNQYNKPGLFQGRTELEHEDIALRRAKGRERTRKYRMKQKEKANQSNLARHVVNNQQRNHIPNLKELSNISKELSHYVTVNEKLYNGQLHYTMDRGSNLNYQFPSMTSGHMPSFDHIGANIQEESAIPIEGRMFPIRTHRIMGSTTHVAEDELALKRAKGRERTRKHRLKQKAKGTASNETVPEKITKSVGNYELGEQVTAANANGCDFVLVYPADILGESVTPVDSVHTVAKRGSSAGITLSSSKPMTAAERQRKYRERLRQCPEKLALYKQKQQQRYMQSKACRTEEQITRIRSLSVVRSRNYRNRKRQKESVKTLPDGANVSTMQTSSCEGRDLVEETGEPSQRRMQQPAYLRQRKYYENLRRSPERYAVYKEKDAERKKRSRKHMSPEQVERCRIRDRERQRRYRARKRGLVEDDDNSSSEMLQGPSSAKQTGRSAQRGDFHTSAKTKYLCHLPMRPLGSGTVKNGQVIEGNITQVKQECDEDVLSASEIENQSANDDDYSGEGVGCESDNHRRVLFLKTDQEAVGSNSHGITDGVQEAQGGVKGEFVVSSAGNIPLLVKPPNVKGEFSCEAEEVAQVIPCDPPNVDFDWTELDLFASNPGIDRGDGDDGDGAGELPANETGEDVGIVSGSARRKAFFPTRHHTAGLTLNAANSLGVSSDSVIVTE